jgi:hypothetical protein
MARLRLKIGTRPKARPACKSYKLVHPFLVMCHHSSTSTAVKAACVIAQRSGENFSRLCDLNGLAMRGGIHGHGVCLVRSLDVGHVNIEKLLHEFCLGVAPLGRRRRNDLTAAERLFRRVLALGHFVFPFLVGFGLQQLLQPWLRRERGCGCQELRSCLSNFFWGTAFCAAYQQKVGQPKPLGARLLTAEGVAPPSVCCGSSE